MSYAKCCNDGKLTEKELRQLAALTPASFCPATCSQRAQAGPNSMCAPRPAKEAERLMPLVVLNTIIPVLRWDASSLLGQIKRSDEPGEAILSSSQHIHRPHIGAHRPNTANPGPD